MTPPPPADKHDLNPCTLLAFASRAAWALPWAVAAAALLPLHFSAASETVPGFEDVTAQTGLTHLQRQVMATSTPQLMTGGGAVGDFFGNGRNDLFVTRYDDTDIFYMNMGDGTFEDRTTEVFGENPLNAPTNGALLADLDNDGHLDLYVTGVGTWRHYLYMNDGNGRLIEEGRKRGAANEREGPVAGMSVTAGDYTGDGYLDLYISDWSDQESANRLLRNRGEEAPGYFKDVTVEAGLAVPANRWGFGARFADINRNGRLDLVPYNDFGNNQFFWNEGDGTFREAVQETGTTAGFGEMGISVADFNNNGWMDMFITDLGRNALYRNEIHQNVPGLYFTDVASTAGVLGQSWGWGAGTIDYNNDGWRDIVMVTGFVTKEPMRFFHNNGSAELAFTEMSQQLGLLDDGQGRGVIVADFTGNGWQDILVLNHAGLPVLYKNKGGQHDWLRIDLVGQKSNRQGIGAWITVTPDLNNDAIRLTHEVTLETNFLSHSETTAHFGLGDLGDGEVVDHVHIRWPSGLEQDLYYIEPNRLHTIVEEIGLPGKVTPHLAAGASHTVLLSADGSVYTFGDGASGQLGHGTAEDRLVPTPLAPETLLEKTIVRTAAGDAHTVLLSADGTVFTFGAGANGQLGHNDPQNRPLPVRVAVAEMPELNVTAIAAGAAHTVLLSSDGEVLAFGKGSEGQLGHGDRNDGLMPTPINHENLSAHTITKIAAGESHTVLLSTEGKVFTFGKGSHGQLGHGDSEARLVPTLIQAPGMFGHSIVEIAAGGDHTVCLSSDGTVFTFGRGDFGQLGHGDATNELVPRPLEHANLFRQRITKVTAGDSHTALLSSAGKVFTFGAGLHGQLGQGDFTSRTVPTPAGEEELSSQTVTGISGGSQHTVLTSSDGTVFTFGGGLAGQLGHGEDLSDLANPTPIANFSLHPAHAYRVRFAAILADANLRDANASPDAIPFGDGVKNLVKYAFNMNLSGADRRSLTPGGKETSGLPSVSKSTDVRHNPVLVIDFLRRKDSGLIYTPKWSTDLGSWQSPTTAPILTEIDSEWERASVRIPLDRSATRAFGNVEIVLP